MSDGQIKTILDRIEGLSTQLNVMDSKLEPMYKVYSSFQGFGSVSLGFFKWVVVPVSGVIGLVYGAVQLFDKTHK